MTLVRGVLVAPGPTTATGWAPTGDILPGPTGTEDADVAKGGRFGKGTALGMVAPVGKGVTVVIAAMPTGGIADIGGTEGIGGTEYIGIGWTDIDGILARGGIPLTGGIPGIKGALEAVVAMSGGAPPAIKEELKDDAWLGNVCIGGTPDINEWLLITPECIGGTVAEIKCWFEVECFN